MFIIADKRIPSEAKSRLNKHGKVLFFESTGITYAAISGHPDIFFCKIEKGLIIAPNTPNNFKAQLNNFHISFLDGKNKIRNKYPGIPKGDPIRRFVVGHSTRQNLIRIRFTISRRTREPFNNGTQTLVDSRVPCFLHQTL